jgi:sec-independent protein translocase protein TatC
MNEFKKYITEYANYLEDLRKRLYRLVIYFISAFAVGFFLTTPFLRFFIDFLKIKEVVITTTSPFQIVDLAMSIGVFFAIIATLPVLTFQIYSFLKSALSKKEKRLFFLLLPIGLLLFIVGFSYGFATLYYALKIIAKVNLTLGVVNLWDISKFISQMVLTSALLGLIFQFPIIITFFVKLNIFSVDFLRSKRRHAWVAIFAFVSLLPPTDGLSLIIMSVPLLAIYELTIIVNSYKKRNDQVLNYN